MYVDFTVRTLSSTDFSQSASVLCASTSMIWGGWSSNEIAYRRPRPGTKFKVGARIASTSIGPAWNKYIRYSRHGESGGVTLREVTGKIDMDDSVRPYSAIFPQRTEFASIFFV